MSPINWAKLGFEFLKSLPTILLLLRELQKVIDQSVHLYQRKQVAKDIAEALKEAREQRDPTKLNELTEKLVNSITDR